jgi:predicted transcriptional regulator
MMTLTIELAPEVEAQLRQAAARQGQDPASFARAAVEEKLREEKLREEKLRRVTEGQTEGHTNGPANGQPNGQPVITPEEEERLLDELARGSEKLPILPPEANSREWIYADHD